MQAAAKRYETPLPGPTPMLSEEEAMRRDRTLVDVPMPSASPKARTSPPPIPAGKAPIDWSLRIEEVKDEARKRTKLLQSTIDDHRATKRLLSNVNARTRNLSATLDEHAEILNNHADVYTHNIMRLDGHDRQIRYLGVAMEKVVTKLGGMEQVVAKLNELDIEVNTGLVTDQEFNDRLAGLEAAVHALQHTQARPIIYQKPATSVTAEAIPFPWFKILAAASVLGAIGSFFAIHLF